jgi:aminopeptidase
MDKQNLEKLANQFMRQAIKVTPGDNVMVAYRGPEAFKLAEICAVEVLAAGAHPSYDDLSSAATNRDFIGLSAEEMNARGQKALQRMKQMQCWIGIKDDDDQGKLRLTTEELKNYNLAMRSEVNYRVDNTRWLIVAMPTEGFAKSCGMDVLPFEDFYLKACLVDYDAMSEAVKPLQEIMTKTRKVRIVSPAQETDLTFELNGLKAHPCTGQKNIPDGECYTAPVRNSANGIIKFGPSIRDGKYFSFIELAYKNGHIDGAEAKGQEETKQLNDFLDTDEGGRYIGEFAVNFNPFIQYPTGRILFDEKINGGIHLAAGNPLGETDNGNRSAIHWDMVHIQRPDFGGGELWFDDRLVRKDGLFVVPELLGLNPDKLAAAATPTRDSVTPRKKAASLPHCDQ